MQFAKIKIICVYRFLSSSKSLFCRTFLYHGSKFKEVEDAGISNNKLYETIIEFLWTPFITYIHLAGNEKRS